MATETTSLNDRLKSVRAALAEKRAERKDLVKARDEAKESFAGSDVPVAEMTGTEDFKAAQETVRALGECDDAIADLQVAEVGVLELMGERQNGARSSVAGPEDDLTRLRPNGWDVNGLLQAETYQRLRESSAFSSKARLGSVLLGKLAEREDTAAFLSSQFRAEGSAADPVSSTGKTGAIPADRRGIVPPNLKRLSLLDLIPTGTTDSNLVEYVQVVTIPSSAAEWDESSAKQQEHLTTVDADAPVRTIAGYLKVKKNALADVAGLQTLIGVLLPHSVRRRIESQMLVGNGSGENLRGILNTSGIGAPTFHHGDNTADAILRAITVVVLSDADPDFVALHPLTQQDLMLMRTESGAGPHTGAYLYGSPASPAAPTIWGLAMTPNRAVPSDQPLVGDSMSATLLVREGVNVLVSDSDQDDFIKNRATVLAEARVAFPVWRPSSFAVAALTS